MPRTLPWATTTTPKPSTSSASTPRAPPASSRRTPSSPSDLVDRDLNPLNRTPSPRRAGTSPGTGPSTILTPPPPAARNPSSSPPPTVSAPPAVAYMLPGPAADDRWLLVEDEFLAVAQRFTSPLHAAEYARVKRLARARGPAALRALPRATDGSTAAGTLLKRKLGSGAGAEAEAAVGKKVTVGKKVRGRGRAEDGGDAWAKALRRSREVLAPEDEGEDEGLEVGGEEEEKEEFLDPLLAGLMTTSQAQADGRQTSRVVGVGKAKTRAAAGFGQSPNTGNRKRDALAEERAREERALMERVALEELGGNGGGEEEEEEEETDDDDLDVKTYGAVQQLSKLVAAPKSIGAATATRTDPVPKGEPNSLSSRLRKDQDRDHDVANGSRSTTVRSSLQPSLRQAESSSRLTSASSPSKSGKGTQLAARVAQRRAATREQREREQNHEAKLMDEVPTFLI